MEVSRGIVGAGTMLDSRCDTYLMLTTMFLCSMRMGNCDKVK